MERPIPKKILIVLLGAIGDVVRGLPLAVRIKREWPSTLLYWAVEPRSRAIVENHKCIDKIFVFDRPRGLSAYMSFVQSLRAENFDLVLDLQRHFKSGFTSWYTGASKRIGFNRSNAKEFNWIFNTETIPSVQNFSPKILQYQKFGDFLGLEVLTQMQFELESTQEEKDAVKRLVGDELPNGCQARAALILGSTWPSRFWTVQGYCELISRLFYDKGIKPYLIGAHSEEGMANQIMAQINSNEVVNLVGKTSLRELIGVFECMDMSIGSDSGPMHIAAAVGNPVISLWGATSYKRSAPYINGQKMNVQNFGEELVVDAQVSCSPCYKANCPIGDMRCMQSITVDMILGKVELVQRLQFDNGVC